MSEAPTDFREYAAWRNTGELPEQKEEPTLRGRAEDQPPAKTAPDSETDDSQETGDEKDEPQEGDEGAPAKGKGGSRQRKIDKLTRENEELRRQMAEKSVKPQDKPRNPRHQPPASQSSKTFRRSKRTRKL